MVPPIGGLVWFAGIVVLGAVMLNAGYGWVATFTALTVVNGVPMTAIAGYAWLTDRAAAKRHRAEGGSDGGQRFRVAGHSDPPPHMFG